MAQRMPIGPTGVGPNIEEECLESPVGLPLIQKGIETQNKGVVHIIAWACVVAAIAARVAIGIVAVVTPVVVWPFGCQTGLLDELASAGADFQEIRTTMSVAGLHRSDIAAQGVVTDIPIAIALCDPLDVMARIGLLNLRCMNHFLLDDFPVDGGFLDDGLFAIGVADDFPLDGFVADDFLRFFGLVSLTDLRAIIVVRYNLA